ncbi:PQQ-binding-like beta-propeller repeat protein [Dyella mobilis]|nr:PQQ-binding-like beta-propeller repeat protein [Dyella mobilis]
MGLLWLPLVAQACDLAPVVIAAGTAKVGDVVVNFGEADDSVHPSAWQGPLRISKSGAPACSVDSEVSIAEQPVMYGNGVLYVSTYSGSDDRVYALDTQTCGILWRSNGFSAKPVFKRDRLVMDGKVMLIDPACRPLDSHHE